MQYVKKARDVPLRIGIQVMVLMPAEATGDKRKLARPFHGPFRMLTVTPTNAEVRLASDPKATPLLSTEFGYATPHKPTLNGLADLGDALQLTLKRLFRIVHGAVLSFVPDQSPGP